MKLLHKYKVKYQHSLRLSLSDELSIYLCSTKITRLIFYGTTVLYILHLRSYVPHCKKKLLLHMCFTRMKHYKIYAV